MVCIIRIFLNALVLQSVLLSQLMLLLMSLFGKVFPHSGHCNHLCKHGAVTVSDSCSWVRVAAREANRCHSRVMVLDAAEASPWQRFACRAPACAKEAPGSTRSPPLWRGSAGVPGHHIVSPMINYRPDEMWRLWKCHRDDMGLSVRASREECIAQRHLEGYGAPAAHCLFKERTFYCLSCFLLDFLCLHFLPVLLYLYRACSLILDFKISFVISSQIKLNVNPIKVTAHQSILAHSEWAVNTWLY